MLKNMYFYIFSKVHRLYSCILINFSKIGFFLILFKNLSDLTKLNTYTFGRFCLRDFNEVNTLTVCLIYLYDALH